MQDFVETIQVSLQQDGFCIATGPHDSSIEYPCPTNPFAPVLIDSPVVLHLYCPELFPDEVLKVHAEHLGHFLSLQCVPPINAEFERALFLGLCEWFTRETVLVLYKKFLTDEASWDEALYMAVEDDEGGDGSHRCVFVDVPKRKTRRTVSLLRGLLELFDLEELRYDNIPHEHGQEPKHMLFLYLIQLLAIFVSSCMEQKDLATVMSVASATFLEVNFCNPLCAATLGKPMFIPYYEGRRESKSAKGKDKQVYPKERLKHYRLFMGYELDNKGCDVSSRDEMCWTEHSIMERMRECKIVEGESKKLWFVAPQMGDRMLMVKDSGLKMMGGQTDEKALGICSYLMSDNVMAYMQCAIFGTISNMLPCHANSDFTESVMATVGNSMSKFSDAVRHQSANLMMELSKISNSCLYTVGVGFAGQYKGNTLYFGNVFTGPEEKRPPTSQGRDRTKGEVKIFTSVTLGIADNAMMKTMLSMALKPDQKNNLDGMLSTSYKSVGFSKVTTDSFFYARYHHALNVGEFTEVAQVKAMSDPRYNSMYHKQELTHDGKYQLTVCHGALPMCTLTLAMTMRQTVMMIMGFFCAELARLAYLPETVDVIMCKSLVSLPMAAKFRHGKDTGNTNVFKALYGDSLKLSGSIFSTPSRFGINYYDLEVMEWLQADDERLPSYIQSSLKLIGDTKREVRKIMNEKDRSYNRVVFFGETGVMSFASMFANKEYMIHTPLMALSSMRVFSNSVDSYGTIKMSKCRGWSYPVKIYSNRCINASLYMSQWSRNNDCLTSATNSTISETVERIKRGVSSLLPRIEMNRLKMMSPELNDTDFDLLVSAVKKNNIKVIGQLDSASRSTLPGPSRSLDQRTCMKRAGESPDVSPYTGANGNKKAKMDSELTLLETDMDFGFDDSN
ncbi:hypothetical protein D5F01_LYC23962 [Larimichthys crocea]|uniref:Uncharacterized protein n=1 Tax=Larimichthys crocea TaxID=215358 RepID=A0A6G0HG53_LARCR|nr:hypothetical protein D5F01_LYC23962 [Larimichthys crocea]